MNGSAGQVREYERLKVIYKISKLLSVFENIEVSLPEILTSTAEVFPLYTAVLIDRWENTPYTNIWHSIEVSPQQITDALTNAKEAYLYMAGATPIQSEVFLNNFDADCITPFPSNLNLQKKDTNHKKNYIVLPLIVNNLPPLGVLQLEGAFTLGENDLEFTTALADLISIALDRYHKTKKEREVQEALTISNQATLSHSQEKVEHLEIQKKLRESFVTLLTHDLRTPLTVILSSSQMILRQISNKKIATISANLIVKQVQRIDKMITDLLDANRIHSGKSLPVHRERVNLTNVISDTIDELKMTYGDRFIFKNKKEICSLVDLNGIKRIIENLSNNAIKYGFTHTPVNINLVESEEDIRISVHNQGEGISAEDQKSLYQQFRRTDVTDKSTIKGWGIGLALVLGVAQAHGGSVKIESEIGNETIFTVILPKTLEKKPQTPSKF